MSGIRDRYHDGCDSFYIGSRTGKESIGSRQRYGYEAPFNRGRAGMAEAPLYRKSHVSSLLLICFFPAVFAVAGREAGFLETLNRAKDSHKVPR